MELVDVTAEAVVDGRSVSYTVTMLRESWDHSEAVRNHVVREAVVSVHREVGMTRAPITLSEPRFYTIDLGTDEDTTPDDACVDRDGFEYPEHDYDDTECRRCGAEPED